LELYYFYFKEEQVDCLACARVVEVKCLAAEERSRAFEAQVATLARLLCLKRVHEKVCLKEYHFIK